MCAEFLRFTSCLLEGVFCKVTALTKKLYKKYSWTLKHETGTSTAGWSTGCIDSGELRKQYLFLLVQYACYNHVIDEKIFTFYFFFKYCRYFGTSLIFFLYALLLWHIFIYVWFHIGAVTIFVFVLSIYFLFVAMQTFKNTVKHIHSSKLYYLCKLWPKKWICLG